MQPKISNAGNPVHNALALYTLVFYMGSFVSFLIYYFTHDLLWFQTAYAANIGGLLMALLVGVSEMLEELSRQRDRQEKKAVSTTRTVLNLIAFTLFALNLLLLKNQWSTPHPNTFAALWITGDGVACMLYSEFRSIALWLRTKTEEEVSKSDMAQMN